MPGISRGHDVRSIACRFGAAQAANIAVVFAFAIIPVLASSAPRSATAGSQHGAMVDAGRARFGGADAVARPVAEYHHDIPGQFQGHNLFHGALQQQRCRQHLRQRLLRSWKQHLGFERGSQRCGLSADPVHGSGRRAQHELQCRSTSTWGSNLLRVALVLDNTGSMANNNKIGALQAAARNLDTAADL
jgi:hypothetical protein